MTTNRDTQFAGFAEKLYEELAQNVANCTTGPSYKNIEAFKQEQYRIIAQRAYDLVAHTLHWLENDPYYRRSGEATVKDIPDLTTWPEEAK